MAALTFDNVSCYVGDKGILRGVSGDARPGQMVALMGESGSGKTSLLALLYGEPSMGMRQAGAIKLNGSFLTSNMRRDIAYIRQKVVLPPYLTVREHLDNLAVFHVAPPKRAQVVASLLKRFGLRDCADTLIGTGQESADGKGGKKSLSGGQMHRVYIAAEIIRKPRLMLVDEPTSGLDSYYALKVMKEFRKLANDGCTIIVAIHQPASKIFYMFDKLLVLNKGETAFFGTLPESRTFFANTGFPWPEGHNPADHIIMKTHKNPKVLISAYSAAEDGRAQPQQVPQPLGDVENALDAQHQQPQFFLEMIEDGGAQPQPPQQHAKLVEESYHAPFAEQFKTLFYRSWIVSWRSFNPGILSLTVAFALTVGLFCLRHKSLDVFDDDIGRVNLALFAGFIYGVGFMSTIPPSDHRYTEKDLISKEYKTGAYSGLAVFLAKRSAEFLMWLLHPITYSIIIYLLVGLRLDQYMLAHFGLIIVCTHLATAMGMIYADFCEIAPASHALQGVISVLWLFSMGFYVPANKMPDWLGWLRRPQWYSWGFEAMLGIQFQDQTVHHVVNSTFLTPANLARVALFGGPGVSTTYSSEIVLEQLGATTPIWLNFVALFVAFVVLEGLAFLVQEWKVTKK